MVTSVVFGALWAEVSFTQMVAWGWLPTPEPLPTMTGLAPSAAVSVSPETSTVTDSCRT
jgi:hypothetical protein